VRVADTNVLARFLVDDPDDPAATRQRGPATRVMATPVFVPVTVLLELEWVMRGFYDLAARDVNRALRGLCSLETATVEDRDSVLSALELHATGMDFADALYLVRSGQCEAMVTFDRALARRAGKVRGLLPVELLR
jgi:predicted nucleic-acid-binding protein